MSNIILPIKCQAIFVRRYLGGGSPRGIEGRAPEGEEGVGLSGEDEVQDPLRRGGGGPGSCLEDLLTGGAPGWVLGQRGRVKGGVPSKASGYLLTTLILSCSGLRGWRRPLEASGRPRGERRGGEHGGQPRA